MRDKDRILNMPEARSYCKCPGCHKIVKPKYQRHFALGRSGLYYCPLCFVAKAGMFWVSYGTEHQLAMERLEEIKKNQK